MKLKTLAPVVITGIAFSLAIVPQAHAQDTWACAWDPEVGHVGEKPAPRATPVFKLKLSGQKLIYSDNDGTNEFQILLHKDHAIAAASAWIKEKMPDGTKFNYLNIAVTMITIDTTNGSVLAYPMDSWLGGMRGNWNAKCMAD